MMYVSILGYGNFEWYQEQFESFTAILRLDNSKAKHKGNHKPAPYRCLSISL